MKRRPFLAAAACVSAGYALSTPAQPARTYRIGYLPPTDQVIG